MSIDFTQIALGLEDDQFGTAGQAKGHRRPRNLRGLQRALAHTARSRAFDRVGKVARGRCVASLAAVGGFAHPCASRRIDSALGPLDCVSSGLLQTLPGSAADAMTPRRGDDRMHDDACRFSVHLTVH